MEIMLKSNTQILDSPKTIDVDADVETDTATTITLSELQHLHVYQRVSVFCTVTDREDVPMFLMASKSVMLP